MHTGQCACRAVTYELTADPMAVHCCHCSECQRLTGAAYALNAIIESDHVVLKGPTHAAELPTPSGKGQIITSCAKCGTAVYTSYMIREGKLRYIRVGTLNAPEACPPDVQIFTSSKQPWVPLNPDIPIFEGFYSIKDVWPAASYDRWTALFGEG